MTSSLAASRAIANRLAQHPAAGLVATCGVAAFAIGALVGPYVVFHPGSAAVGGNPGSDFQIMAWSLDWWPWAVGHGADPLHTQLLWAPFGFSTLWMTTIPSQALLGLPITLTAGSLVAYNVLILLAVPLAAGAAYLLCHELTGRFWPSLVGGLLFGLSPYMLGHTLSQHLNLTFVFPIPLLALLAVRYARGKTSTRRFVAAFAALLLLQVGSSLELFVDLTLFLGLGVVIAVLGSGARRQTVLRTARAVGLSYALCLPVLVTIAAVALSAPHEHLRFAPAQFSIDLLNIVVPTQTALAGTGHSAVSVSQHYVGNVGEQTGYLGVPLLLVALLAVRTEWRRGAWLAGALFIAALALSLGPALTVGGRSLVSLPFAMEHLPILGYALPARLSVFTALGAACLCALWLARPQRAWLRTGVAALVLVSLLPNISTDTRIRGRWGGSVDSAGQPVSFGWSARRVTHGFTADRDWTRIVKPGSTVLVLPPGARTPSQFWQAHSDLRFALAVSGTPFAPADVATTPTIVGLLGNNLFAKAGPPLGGARLRSYLLANHVGSVALTVDAVWPWGELVERATAARPVLLGNMHVYPVSRRLRPLAARGFPVLATPTSSRTGHEVKRGSRPLLEAAVVYDGHRGHLRARLRSAGAAPGHSVTLSSPAGDADDPAVAVDDRGHAAVAFTESRDRKALLRAATLSGGRWRIVTLDTRTEPISNPQIVIDPDGRTTVTWIDEDKPMATVRAATLAPGGAWQGPITLTRSSNVISLALLPDRGGGAMCAWRDVAGTEARVRATTYQAGRWSPVTTVASTLERLNDISFDGGSGGPLLKWRFSYADKRLLLYQARRKGSGWAQPSGPARTVRDYDPPYVFDPWNERH